MKNLNIVCLILLGLMLAGCSSDTGTSPAPLRKDSFSIEAKYDYIRSVMGGGGHFIIRIAPDFAGTVGLYMNAADCLHAHLDRQQLGRNVGVAEITINPDSSCDYGIYQIELRGVNEDNIETLILEVEIMQWYNCYPEYALQVLPDFDEWLRKNYPEYSDLSDQEWFCYDTYPQILVVSHWTLLSDDYEIRICHHNTIHPHNWTMYRLRKRGEFEAELACMKENDITAICEIPVSEYPSMFGY